MSDSGGPPDEGKEDECAHAHSERRKVSAGYADRVGWAMSARRDRVRQEASSVHLRKGVFVPALVPRGLLTRRTVGWLCPTYHGDLTRMRGAEMSDSGREIVRLQKELEDSDEWRRLNTARLFTHSMALFRGNEDDLLKVLEWSQTSENWMALWDRRHRQRLRSFQLQITRLLHNYVAAAETLVSHSRRFYRKHYAATGKIPEYQETIERIFKGDNRGIPAFLKGLRNYVLHYALPPIINTVSFRSGEGSSHRLLLDRTKLLAWDGWGDARVWLETRPGDIDLHDVVLSYQRLHRDFYEWFLDQLRTAHTEDERFVAEMERRINALRQGR